ncbi:MAG: DUF4190 domain-containing protein [Planctomycetota bacterium]|jgi:membrane protease YdiL (CAAX protease family)
MIIAYEILAVLGLVVLPLILGCISWRKITAKDFEESVYARLFSSLFLSLGTIFLILLIAVYQPRQLLSVGIDFRHYEEMFAGIVVLCVPIFIYYLGYRIIYGKALNVREVDYTQKHVHLWLSYRTPLQRAIHLLSLVLSAVSEELLFRGYFIFLWGQRTNALIPCAVASCIAFVALHLYQGKKTIIYHTLLAATLAVSAILTGSIMVSIGAHIYLNLIATIKLWRLDSKRKEKSSATSTESPTETTRHVKPTSRMAIAALILGILGLCTFPLSFGVPSIVGLFTGIKALSEIKRSGGELSGRGLAITGIVTSLISIVIVGLLILVFGLALGLPFLFFERLVGG